MEPIVTSLSVQQASAALLDVQRTQHRLSILRGYQYGAPHFLLWGMVWLAGFACSGFFPRYEGPVWLGLDVLGVVGGLLIVRATPIELGQGRKTWRFLAAGTTLAIFMAASYYVLAPTSASQLGAFPALVMALFYILIGIWRGSRWAVVGLVLGTLTVLGYALLREYFMVWMAVVGGGTLLLTGMWMRNA